MAASRDELPIGRAGSDGSLGARCRGRRVGGHVRVGCERESKRFSGRESAEEEAKLRKDLASGGEKRQLSFRKQFKVFSPI